MLTHPIETVIFDLDGTLRHNLPSADDVQYNFAIQLDVRNAPGKQLKGARWAHYYWAQSPELFADMDQFNEMDDGFWVNYSYRYLRSLSVTEVKAADLAPQLFQLMDNGFNPEDHVYSCVPETLQAIKEAGFTLGLISNRSAPCQEYCEQLGLLGYFEFAYVAAEVDVWKPDPRIFDRALEITGTSPERTIYVGDNYYADTLGARNAGLQPILLDPNGVFPDADCTIIQSIRDLGSMLTSNR
jgi:HAD superfamily hydrolase (TIGR01549 family)